MSSAGPFVFVNLARYTDTLECRNHAPHLASRDQMIVCASGKQPGCRILNGDVGDGRQIPIELRIILIRHTPEKFVNELLLYRRILIKRWVGKISRTVIVGNAVDFIGKLHGSQKGTDIASQTSSHRRDSLGIN